jgi:hypothetical protein
VAIRRRADSLTDAPTPCRWVASAAPGHDREATNPKTAAFFLALIPQFVDAGQGSVAVQFSVLGLISIALNTGMAVLVVSAAAALRGRVAAQPNLLRRLRQGWARCWAASASRSCSPAAPHSNRRKTGSVAATDLIEARPYRLSSIWIGPSRSPARTGPPSRCPSAERRRRAGPDDAALVDHRRVVADAPRARHVMRDADAVAPSRFTQSTISPSITAPMMGSRPVVGSSKKMMSGSAAMARARPTRFCMPPESSAGERSPTEAARPDLRQHLRRLVARGAARDAALGEQLEADILPDRQAVEQRAVLEQHADAVVQLLTLPPRQRRHVAPVDLDHAGIGADQAEDAFQRHRLARARAAEDHHRMPARMSRSTPSSTVFGPKDFDRPRSRIFDRLAAHRLKKIAVRM